MSPPHQALTDPTRSSQNEQPFPVLSFDKLQLPFMTDVEKSVSGLDMSCLNTSSNSPSPVYVKPATKQTSFEESWRSTQLSPNKLPALTTSRSDAGSWGEPGIRDDTVRHVDSETRGAAGPSAAGRRMKAFSGCRMWSALPLYALDDTMLTDYGKPASDLNYRLPRALQRITPTRRRVVGSIPSSWKKSEPTAEDSKDADKQYTPTDAPHKTQRSVVMCTRDTSLHQNTDVQQGHPPAQDGETPPQYVTQVHCRETILRGKRSPTDSSNSQQAGQATGDVETTRPAAGGRWTSQSARLQDLLHSDSPEVHSDSASYTKSWVFSDHGLDFKSKTQQTGSRSWTIQTTDGSTLSSRFTAKTFNLSAPKEYEPFQDSSTDSSIVRTRAQPDTSTRKFYTHNMESMKITKMDRATRESTSRHSRRSTDKDNISVSSAGDFSETRSTQISWVTEPAAAVKRESKSCVTPSHHIIHSLQHVPSPSETTVSSEHLDVTALPTDREKSRFSSKGSGWRTADNDEDSFH